MAQQREEIKLLYLILNKLEAHDLRFDKIDKRLDEHEKRLVKIEKRLDKLEKRMNMMDKRLNKLEAGQAEIISLFSSLSNLVSDNRGRIQILEKNFTGIRKAIAN